MDFSFRRLGVACLTVALVVGCGTREIDVEKYAGLLRSADEAKRAKAMAKLVEAGSPAAGPVIELLKDEGAGRRNICVEILGKLAAATERPLGSANEDKAARVLCELYAQERSLADSKNRACPMSDPLLRGGILKALAHYDGGKAAPKAIATLVKALSDPDRRAVEAAQTSLLTQGAASAGELVAAAAGDVPDAVRAKAQTALDGVAAEIDKLPTAARIKVLSRWRSPTALRTLARLAKDASGDARQEALAGVKALLSQGIADKEAASALAGLLSDSDEEVRFAAAEALTLMRDEQARPVLEKALQSKARAVAACELLAALGGSQAADALTPLLANASEEIRNAAAAALASAGDSRPAARLKAALDLERPSTSLVAAEILCRMGEPAGVDFLLKAFRQADLRAPASAALARCRTSVEATEAFAQCRKILAQDVRKALQAKDESKCLALVTTLQRMASPESAAMLVDITRGPEAPARVVLAAIEALGRSGQDKARDSLAKLVRREGGQYVSAAAVALAQLGDARAVPHLKTMLETADADARLRIASALGEVRDDQAAGPLLPLLDSDQAEVREAAALSLAQIASPVAADKLRASLPNLSGDAYEAAAISLCRAGDEKALAAMTREAGAASPRQAAAVGALSALARATRARQTAEKLFEKLTSELKAEDKKVRLKAANALGVLAAVIGSGRVSEPLVPLLKDKDAKVRIAVAGILRQQGADQITKYRSQLAEAMKDENSEVKLIAAEALGSIGEVTAIGYLVDLLKDKESRIRLPALEALGKLGGAAVDQLIEKAQGDVRWGIVTALGEIGDSKALSLLLTSLTDSDENVRVAAAIALGKIPDQKSVVPLVTRLQDDSARVRTYAKQALVKLGPRAVEALAEALTKTGQVHLPENRLSDVADILAQTGDDTAINALCEALKSDELDLRAQAARALGEVCARSADASKKDGVATRLATVTTKKSLAPEKASPEEKQRYAAVRVQIVQALGKIGSATAIPELNEIVLFDDDRNVVYSANAALNALEGAPTPLLERLQKILADPQQSPDSRREAAEQLGKRRHLSAVANLEVALNDSDLHVRQAAATALKKITAKEYRYSKEQ